MDPETLKLVPGGAEADADQALKNIEAIVKAAGGNMSHGES
jgi:enamine deaminase RidA (YjgF/YER057c/UK114 family)